MTVNAKISETVKIEQAILNADITTDRESAFRTAVGFQRFRAFLQTATVTATDFATIQLLQATDADGADKKALSAVVTFTAGSGGAPARIEVEAEIDELDSANGFTFIAVKATSDNATALLAAATLELHGASYKPV